MKMLRHIVVLLVLFAALLSTDLVSAQDELKIVGTYQIQKDTRQGWLILNLEIPKGHHIYALTQEGSPPPTKVRVAESDSFEILRKFKANKKPKVIEHDPIFEQRVEKHVGKVAFIAPVRIAENADLENVEFEIKLKGQICDDFGCKLLNKPIEIEFAGYYEEEKKEKKKKGN